MPEPVQPLRITKHTPASSPSKMVSSSYRPLSEISPMERRGNSPSYNQAAKQMMFKGENSPFDSSPWSTNASNASARASSPRAFWKGRDPTTSSPSRFAPNENAYDIDVNISPQRRSSIEKLKQVSRVKNSSMFEREQKNNYDPASPQVDRPIVTGRPLSVQVHGNAFDGQGLEGMRKGGHRRGQSQTKLPIVANSPPPKSDRSNTARVSDASKGDVDSSILSAASGIKVSTPRPLRRYAKSVTFDSAPPEINEYETVTPDPSSIASGSRQGSFDDDEDEYDYDVYDPEDCERDDSFDASLEDTEKTPVVLPEAEDWRHMSPSKANSADLVRNFEDPFSSANCSPSPSAIATSARPTQARTDSQMSNSERPLPSIPRLPESPTRGLSAAAERMGSSSRSLPTPPRAANVSKAEILGMQKRSSISIEDRLSLMGIEDSRIASPSPKIDSRIASPSPKMDARASRAARLQAAHKDTGLGIHIHEDATAGEKNKDVVDKIPHISRESILQKVKADHEDNPYDGSGYSDDLDYANLDPDVAIPSREASSNFDEIPAGETPIKEEDSLYEVDVYEVMDAYGSERSPSQLDSTYDREGSVVRKAASTGEEIEIQDAGNSNSTTEDEGPPTPKADVFALAKPTAPLLAPLKGNAHDSHNGSLPQFDSLMDDDDFKSGFASFMSREDERPGSEKSETATMTSQVLKLEAVHEFLQRPSTPLSERKYSQSSYEYVSDVDVDVDAPGTPGSVIHNPIHSHEASSSEELEVAEHSSSVKAHDSRLKTRPSPSPADVATMAAQRRVVSGEAPAPVPVPALAPPVPQKSPRRRSSIGVANAEDQALGGCELRKSSLQQIQLDGIASTEAFDVSLSHELGEEFDRVMQAQKKGYLMRQNTKMVVARSRDFSDENTSGLNSGARGTRSAGPSPRKASGTARPWTTEQWNGKPRRKSIRTASGSRKNVANNGALPPLPGQESQCTAGFDSVELSGMRDGCWEEAEWEDGAERGRLFVKVIGVKDLELPLPQHERTTFQLTLDNGLHCVTTSWLDLSRNAPVGQEFELIVLNDLEFHLTLQTKLVAPPQPEVRTPMPSVTGSPTKAISPMKKKTLSNLLMSPKKRKEAEARRAAEERSEQEQREREAAAKARSAAAASQAKALPGTAWELLHDLVAPDGSFARSYINLKAFEDNCFGRALAVDVPAYNEWATEHDTNVIESMRSKRGNWSGGEIVKRPPYEIGTLQLMLLYVPKPKGVGDEGMPRSLNAAVREMEKVREAAGKKWEGVLSQQGGDCPYWRRRFFRLAGTKLTAFHESTRQPRATINLAKAVKLIDDKSSLIHGETLTGNSASPKKRRKSAFAEEEEGYMFVEEGFRIRFANGETIDFYADNAAQKAEWMRVLADVVGKQGANVSESHPAWTDFVFRREQKAQLRSSPRKPVHGASASASASASIPTAMTHGQSYGEERRPSCAPKAEVLGKSSMLDFGPAPVVAPRGSSNRPNGASADKSAKPAGRVRSAMGQAERRAKTKSTLF